MAAHWIFKSAIAGICGSTAHSLLMFLKSWAGLLPTFDPYHNLQSALGRLVGSEVNPLVPWALSFVSGATLVSFVFGQCYRSLPGRSGIGKGLVFGLLAWAAVGLLLFPLIGLGMFATNTGLGPAPTLFSLAMILTYSVAMGVTYAALDA